MTVVLKRRTYRIYTDDLKKLYKVNKKNIPLIPIFNDVKILQNTDIEEEQKERKNVQMWKGNYREIKIILKDIGGNNKMIVYFCNLNLNYIFMYAFVFILFLYGSLSFIKI